MVFYIPFIAIPFGLCMLNCDATVTVSLINSASRADTLECRSDGIVSCRINPYANRSSWEINGKPYSTCAPGCAENPNFPKNYSPSYDVVNGVFNLTVDSATFNDSNTTFKCEDGSSFASITIEVVPAYSEIETNVNNTVEGKQVEFKTTCVQPGVEFDWFTVKTDNSDRKTYNQGQYQMNDTTVCSNDLTCGGVGTCKVSSVITIPTIPPFSEGKQRYIEVDVTYNNPYEKKSFRFDEPFLFEDCKLKCWIIILLIYVLRWILLLTLHCFTEWFYYKKSIQKICGMFCTCTVLFVYMPFFGTIVAACLLCCQEEETYEWKRSLCFSISRMCDFGLFLVIFFTCNGAIDALCYWYAVYAVIALVISCIDFGCIAKCLQQKQTETNPIQSELKWLCDSCNQLQTGSESENKCTYCKAIICKKCKPKHVEAHIEKRMKQPYSAIGLNYIVRHELNEKKHMKHKRCDSCEKSQVEWKSENECIYCEDILCLNCKKIHLEKHISIRHSSIGFDYIHALKGMNLNCCHNNKSIESYCLTCQQYLCKWCIKNHAEHRVLRHSQQGAGKKLCQIFCKFCQNLNIRADAKYYSRNDKSFVCENCKSERCRQNTIAADRKRSHQDIIALDRKRGHQDTIALDRKRGHQDTITVDRKRGHHDTIAVDRKRGHQDTIAVDRKRDRQDTIAVDRKRGHQDTIAVDDPDWKCEICEDNDDGTIHPAECYCMSSKKNICAVCFEKISKQLPMQEAIKARRSEHSHLCAFHSVAGSPVKKNSPLIQTDANESPAEVLCLVCNEYLCKMCFVKHLNLKQLLLSKHPGQGKQKNYNFPPPLSGKQTRSERGYYSRASI